MCLVQAHVQQVIPPIVGDGRNLAMSPAKGFLLFVCLQIGNAPKNALIWVKDLVADATVDERDFHPGSLVHECAVARQPNGHDGIGAWLSVMYIGVKISIRRGMGNAHDKGRVVLVSD